MSEEKKKEIPESCFKCEYAYCCNAPYYGSTLCKHSRAIEQQFADRTNKHDGRG